MTALKKSPDKQANKCWVIVRFERAGHAVLFLNSVFFYKKQHTVRSSVIQCFTDKEICTVRDTFSPGNRGTFTSIFCIFDTYGDCKWSNHTFARFSRDDRL